MVWWRAGALMVLGVLLASCAAGGRAGGAKERGAKMPGMTTEEYWGWTIGISAEPEAGGMWVARAKLAAGPGTGGEPGEVSAEGKTEEEARAAVRAMATRAVDEQRVSRGKP